MKVCRWVVLCLLGCSCAQADVPAPVIDMHLHALDYTDQGPPPLGMCTPMQMPVWDQRKPYGAVFMRGLKEPTCEDPVWSPMSDEELLERTLAQVRKHNVYGVLSGTREKVDAWMLAAPGRFMPGLGFSLDDSSPSPESLVALRDAGKLQVLAEITTQYQGIVLLSGKLRIFADSPWCNRQPLIIFSDDCFNSDIYQHHTGTNSAADGIISPGRLDQSYRGRKFTKYR